MHRVEGGGEEVGVSSCVPSWRAKRSISADTTLPSPRPQDFKVCSYNMSPQSYIKERVQWYSGSLKHVIRDIQRLPTTTFSLVLRKEYFDGSQRDSHAVHYI
jgi:hypothetical protein